MKQWTEKKERETRVCKRREKLSKKIEWEGGAEIKWERRERKWGKNLKREIGAIKGGGKVERETVVKNRKEM